MAGRARASDDFSAGPRCGATLIDTSYLVESKVAAEFGERSNGDVPQIRQRASGTGAPAAVAGAMIAKQRCEVLGPA
jgi:hypothetical protein